MEKLIRLTDNLTVNYALTSSQLQKPTEFSEGTGNPRDNRELSSPGSLDETTETVIERPK